MFLEEKLKQVLKENLERKASLGETMNASVELINVCIDHVRDRIKPKDTWTNVFNVVKQTDNIWRTFAKKAWVPC